MWHFTLCSMTFLWLVIGDWNAAEGNIFPVLCFGLLYKNFVGEIIVHNAWKGRIGREIHGVTWQKSERGGETWGKLGVQSWRHGRQTRHESGQNCFCVYSPHQMRFQHAVRPWFSLPVNKALLIFLVFTVPMESPLLRTPKGLPTVSGRLLFLSTGIHAQHSGFYHNASVETTMQAQSAWPITVS